MSSIDDYDQFLADNSNVKNDYETASGYQFQTAMDDPLSPQAQQQVDHHDHDDDDDDDSVADQGEEHGTDASAKQEQNGDDDDGEVGTFEFIISEPEKSGGKIGHHWMYTITWMTTLSTYNSPNERHTTKRRFSDFLWLRERLDKEHFGIVVPPVPEKTMLGTVEKFFSSAVDSKALLQYRQRALTKFLSRVGEHPVLQRSKTLQQFLEVDDEAEFNTIRSSKIDASQQPTSHSTFGKLFKKHHTKEPEWITQHRTFLQMLEEGLKQMRQRLQDLIQRRRTLSAGLSEFAGAFRLLSFVEKSYDEGTLSRSLMETSHKADAHSTHILTLANRETIQVIETITYYLGMVDCIKRTMAQLENLRLDRDDTSLAIKTHKATLEKLIRQQAKEERVKQAEKAVFESEEKERAANELYERSSEQFKKDLQRFDTERRVDFTYMLSSFAQLQISSSVDIQQVWKSVEVFVDEPTQQQEDSSQEPRQDVDEDAADLSE